MWLSVNGSGIKDAASSTFAGGIREQGRQQPMEFFVDVCMFFECESRNKFDGHM